MLSIIIFFPVLFALSFFLCTKQTLQTWAQLGSVLQFILACSLFFIFDPSSPNIQLVEKISLIPFLGLQYFVAIDGLSFWYVLLSSFLLPIVVLISSKQIKPLYFFLLFCLCTLSQGAFLSFDAILFYMFFELALLPLFFMIFLWGGEKKVYASFKFLLYTFFASLFLLAGILILMLLHKQATGELSASFLDFYNLNLVFIQGHALSSQSLLFFAFAFAFAVKTPLVPFHTWLPLAHVEAPTGASVFLAAILLKLGTYGWFRLVLPLFPEAVKYYSPLLLFLACLGLVYASFLAFAQTDMKKLVAYSSIAHMAYVILGIFSFNIYGLQGAFYQTLTHGISSAGLFLLVGIIYKKTGTRDFRKLGGLITQTPYLACCFFLITLSAIAFPLTGSFIAEFFILLGSYLSKKFWVYLAITSVVFTACYMLNLFQHIFLYPRSLSQDKKIKDLNLQEFLCLLPIIILIFAMGIFPKSFMKYSKSSLDHLNKNAANYFLSSQNTSKQKDSIKTVKVLKNKQKPSRINNYKKSLKEKRI